MRKYVSLITKDTARFALLFSLVTLCSFLTVLSRGVDWISEWNGASVFYPDSGPFWLMSIFTELVIIGVLIPAVGVSDSMSRPTSFYWGRPVTVLNVLWIKILLLSAVGALIPALFEAVFWLARGFSVHVATDCAVELFAVRIFFIAPFVRIASCSPSFEKYVTALFRLIILVLLATIAVWGLLLPIAEIASVFLEASKASLLGRVTELLDSLYWPLVYSSFWMFALWMAPRSLQRRAVTAVAVICATPLALLMLLSVVAGTAADVAVDSNKQEIRQELFLHEEGGPLIVAHQQTAADGTFTDVRFSRPETPRFAPSIDRCLSLATIKAALEGEGVSVRAIGWLPNCYAFGRSREGAVVHYSRLALDYRLPFTAGSEVVSPSRKIQLVKAIDHHSRVASTIEYEYSLLREGRPVGSVNRAWGEGDGIPRFYFVVHRTTGEVLPLKAFHHPLEGLSPAMLTPSHSRNRQVRLYVYDPQNGVFPSDEWFREADLFVFRSETVRYEPLASSVVAKGPTEAPSDLQEEYVRLRPNQAFGGNR